MTESFSEGEKNLSSLDQAYAEFEAGLSEETRLMGEIDRISKSTVDRAAAERLFDEHAHLVEAARRRSREALEEWLAGLRSVIAEFDASRTPK